MRVPTFFLNYCLIFKNDVALHFWRIRILLLLMMKIMFLIITNWLLWLDSFLIRSYVLCWKRLLNTEVVMMMRLHEAIKRFAWYSMNWKTVKIPLRAWYWRNLVLSLFEQTLYKLILLCFVVIFIIIVVFIVSTNCNLSLRTLSCLLWELF